MRYGFSRQVDTANEGATKTSVDALAPEKSVMYVADIAATEAEAMRQVFSQVMKLLAQGSTRIDPALQRLFPDGYRDDADAAAELRRFSEGTLRDGKLQAVGQVLADLPTDSERQVQLSSQQAHFWLTALTDARLVLGVRLDIGADTDVIAELDSELEREDSKSKVFLLAVYQYLTFLQESLVEALTRRTGERDYA